MNEVRIIGTGSYVPTNRMTNDDLSQIVDTHDEWITSRTGIKERRISTGENTSDLARNAALQAIESAGITPEDIDLIIVNTITPDAFMPSTACMIQGAIGAHRAVCFDVSAACTGFIYGINIATQFLRTGQHQTALIIGAEVLSKVVDWNDRNTCVLFGDGAGASVLQGGSQKGILSIYVGSDGTKQELLQCPAVPVQNTYIPARANFSNAMTMNGNEVFKFAGRIIMESIEKVLQNTGYTLEDVAHIIPHQANVRIIEYAARKLGISPKRFYMNLDRYGNTSAASIPLALDEMVRENRIQDGDKVILVGFGGGLTWGAVLIEWNQNKK